MKKDLEEKIHQFALQMHLDGYLCGYDKGKADILDTIRAEIEKPLREEIFFDTDNAKAQAIALNWCIEIIDKYKEEGSDKE